MLLLAVALKDAIFTLWHMQYVLAAFRQYYLELLAVLNYCTAWLLLAEMPEVKNPASSGKVNEKYMGTFTNNMIIAIKLYCLGILVWLIRQASDLPMSTSILAIELPEPMQVTQSHASPPYPVLYEGRSAFGISIAAQDFIIGGLLYGLGTRKELISSSKGPERDK